MKGLNGYNGKDFFKKKLKANAEFKNCGLVIEKLKNICPSAAATWR